MPGNPTAAPLSSVVIYDGSFSINKSNGKLDQTVGGFYQAYQDSAKSVSSKATAIVGNGQPGFNSTLNVIDSIGPGLFKKPFVGAAGTRWDNPTFDFSMKANDDAYSFHVTSSGGVCLTFSSFVTSTRVVDTDNDGLLDVWETKGLHLNIGDSTHPATFGGCADYPAERCVNLPAMGASPTKPDVFMEIDWLHGTQPTDHLHIPKIAALNAVGDTFANHGIAMHFDVGNNYQGKYYQNNTQVSPYIIQAAGLPKGSLQGGEVLEESDLLCTSINNNIAKNVSPTSLLGQALNMHPLTCEFAEPYAVLSYKRGFLSVKNGFPLAGMVPHFDNSRKDIFRYNLFGHALATFNADGTPTTDNGLPVPMGVPTPLSISGVADRPGADLMITLGLWRFDDVAGCDPTGASLNLPECADQTGTSLVQAGTLLHEFGHNLGLSHAGLGRTPNCMPNYQSQMNYLYQVRGLTDAQGLEHIDFSNGTLNQLDEYSLSKDPTSLGSLTYRVRYYSPSLPSGEGFSTRHCDGSLITDGAHEIRLETSTVTVPDWDRSGTQTPARFDVNFDGVKPPPQARMDVFNDSKDWHNLNLQQIGARLNTDGLSVNVGSLDIGSLDIGSLDIGSLDIGSLDIGSLDIGSLDIGSLDIGSLDIGSLDIGSLDIGSLDIGSLDIGSLNIGEMNFSDATSSLDPTNAAQPLKVQNTATSNILTWGSPTLGLIRHYNVYRVNTQDPTHPTPAAIYLLPSGYSIDGAPPLTTYTDPVNDSVNAGPACPQNHTCFNTTYRYYITSVDIIGTESSDSNSVSSEVTHLFVVADDQNVIYGNSFPTPTFKIFGDVAGSLSATNVVCTYTIASTDRHNVGTYSVITCPQGLNGKNPLQTSPTDAITYLAPDASYNDGTNHTQGRLTITPRHITVTAQHNGRVYDSTRSASTLPTITAGNLVFTDTPNFIETYDTKNVGNNKTLSTSGLVNDTNSGNNYTIDQFINDTTGIITPFPMTISATGINKVYDGTTAATVTLSDNHFTGDVISDSYTTARFPDKNVGKAKPVSVSGISISGTDAPNYTFNTTAMTTADITPRPLTVSATGIKKVYDGTTTTAVSLSDNRIAGDVFTDSYTSAAFTNKNVGTAKVVMVTGISISGTDAGNYMPNPTAISMADITVRPLTISAVTNTKSFDGTTSAAAVPTVSGIQIGDAVTNLAETYDTPAVGKGKTLSVSRYTVNDGNNGSNYIVTTHVDTTGVITKH